MRVCSEIGSEAVVVVVVVVDLRSGAERRVVTGMSEGTTQSFQVTSVLRISSRERDK